MNATTMSAIKKESVMEIWDRLCAEKAAKEPATTSRAPALAAFTAALAYESWAAAEAAKEAVQTVVIKKERKSAKPTAACPHCGKKFISVALHIAKMHQVNEIVRLKEGGVAVHINGVRVAYWLKTTRRTLLHEKDRGQWEVGHHDSITYEDYTNGYAIKEYLSGDNKGKFEVFYMNKQKNIGTTEKSVAFKNYTVRNE